MLDLARHAGRAAGVQKGGMASIRRRQRGETPASGSGPAVFTPVFAVGGDTRQVVAQGWVNMAT